MDQYENFLEDFKNRITTDSKWRIEGKHEYEHAIVEFIEGNKDTVKFTDYLYKIVREDREAVPENVRYAAYCTLHTFYRRTEEHEKLVRLDETNASEFQNHMSSEHFKLLLYVDSSPFKVDISILERARKSAESMPDNTGAWHLLADLVARYYEDRGEKKSEQIEDEKWYQTGLNAVNRAIKKEDNYAKFYATRARLYYITGEYSRALKDIQTAIDKENSRNRDYSTRLDRYQMIKLKIESRIK